MLGLNPRRIIIIALVVFGAYAASRYVPAYLAALQFNDFIRQEVKYAVSSRKTTEDIRGLVARKAVELEIPINPRDIKITRRGPSFTLEINYNWPIDLKVYQHSLPFHVLQSGESFE